MSLRDRITLPFATQKITPASFEFHVESWKDETDGKFGPQTVLIGMFLIRPKDQKDPATKVPIGRYKIALSQTAITALHIDLKIQQMDELKDKLITFEKQEVPFGSGTSTTLVPVEIKEWQGE